MPCRVRPFPPPGALKLLIESALPINAQSLASVRVFLDFYASALSDEDIRREVATYLANWRRLIARTIQEGKDRGLITSRIASDQLAIEIVALVDGFSIHDVVIGDKKRAFAVDASALARSWIDRLTA